MQPGLHSQAMVREGDQFIPHESDPIVRGPIPNEREINAKKFKERVVSFTREGSEGKQPSSLPFKPPGLQ